MVRYGPQSEDDSELFRSADKRSPAKLDRSFAERTSISILIVVIADYVAGCV